MATKFDGKSRITVEDVGLNNLCKGDTNVR